MRRVLSFLLPICATFYLSGCATSTNERLSVLESEANNQQILDMRVSQVEERLGRLETELGELRASLESGSKATTRRKAQPRRVEPSPKPQPASAAPTPTTYPAAYGWLPVAETKSTTPSSSKLDPAAASVVLPNTPAVVSAQSTPVGPSPTEPKSPELVPLESQVLTPSTPTPAPKKNGRTNPQDKNTYEAALALYNKGNYEKAQEGFSSFLKSSPNSPLAPNALYWKGECLYSQGKYDQAILQFQDVVNKYPKHDKAAAALLKAGYSYERMNDLGNARFYWQILLDDFPNSTAAGLARKRMTG